MRAPPPALLVFLGGGIGATLRYLVGLNVPASWAAPLPLAILLINLCGAAALGALVMLADGAAELAASVRLTLGTGVLGGFTTWSTFTVGVVSLLRHTHLRAALIYTALSLIGGPLAVLTGGGAMRLLIRAVR